jgi:hypothetical protein
VVLIHNGFYSATKKNENLSLASKWLELENNIFFFIHLFICAYIVWAISPHCAMLPLSPNNPFSPILLKRRHKE